MKRLYLIGFMGCGKSTIGHLLANRLGYVHIDLDFYIEQRYHDSISALFAKYGEAGFRDIEQRMLREVSELEDVVISTGGGTSCFSDNLEWMLKSGYVVYLKLEIDTLLQRLKRNPERRPMLLPNDDIDAFRKHICDLLQCREPFYERAHVVLPVTNSKIADITERIELLYTDNKIRLT